MGAIHFEELILSIGRWIGLLGVAVIVLGIVFAVAALLRDMATRKATAAEMYRACRQRVGRGLILGLEILVAADIVETVALEPTFADVGVLAVIVAVRTFLGWSLAVELEGRWPWQKKTEA